MTTADKVTPWGGEERYNFGTMREFQLTVRSCWQNIKEEKYIHSVNRSLPVDQLNFLFTIRVVSDFTHMNCSEPQWWRGGAEWAA